MLKFMQGMRAWSGRFTLGLLAAGLVACGGGGGNAGTPINGGGGGTTPPAPAVADLSVELSRTTISNADPGGVEVRVTTLDANRNALPSVPVTFAIDANGVVTPAGTSTDATGRLTASATMGSDRTNRRIQVKVSSGTVQKTVAFDVVDSVSGGRVADLALVPNRADIPSDGSAPMLVQVTTLDVNRAALGGSAVSFRVADPTGDAFVSGGGTTDASTGQLTATVRLGQVKTKRSLRLIASSGSVERSVNFNVVDPVVVVPVAADLTVALDRTNIGNAGSDKVTVTATAVDERRNVVKDIPVTFEVDNNATLAVLNGLTDARGEAKAEVRIGADKSNRIITVVVRAGGLAERRAAFRVTGVRIQSTAVPALPIASSQGNRVEYRVVDVNQSAMAGIPITVTPSIVAPNPNQGPVTVSGLTDINGSYVYTYTAPAQSGPLTLTASAAGETAAQSVTIPEPNTNIPPASPTPSPPTLTMVPNVVRVNSGGETSNRAEIRALFLSSGNTPVRNVRVRFQLVDTNNIGGTISTGTQTVLSDANGLAVSSYSPADRSSPTDGVTIRACWSVNDLPPVGSPGDCPNQSDIRLTVVSDPLAITIGTDNKILSGPSTLTYIKRYVLLVVDAAGNPKPDVQLTPVVDLLRFIKGRYFYNLLNSRWENETSITAVCANEDANRNGAIDGLEDLNGNGQLDPRKSDVSVSMVGSTRTDANGTAIVQIEYPKNYASWLEVKISVAAAGVLSPPGTFFTVLPVDATELTDRNVAPPFVFSPYGLQVGCANPN